ncbi:PepSY domain-containing protein [Dyadobacter sp. CY312]|uniref:PepSY-associated TM helix domain-containing protein n=1 Tax=Dyadobacter sp. CY312 TaxID=2907303 RepID=UPI001F1EA7D0|nr:PepSY-associated TM helix domain-containing protein [Dyadobacter sp. CY312]MCE7043314.1 PepSY domain-containing protein [Dyadobacter sp. CY312]
MNPLKRSDKASQNGGQVKKEGKSTFRKINDWLHLWLGLISGIIVFIVCITGCIWVFNDEITWLIEPESRAEKEEIPVLTPSVIRAIAADKFPGQKVTYANLQQGRAVNVGVGEYDAAVHYTLLMNPYTGEIQATKKHLKDEQDFFRWILDGHRFLWFPWEIGRPIVNYGTMVFVVLLITGLIWWYPKKWTQSTRDKSFKIKWNGTWKRINLDLHNVLGFYSLLFLLAIALTGMVYGIEWYSNGLYWVTSGGEAEPEWKETTSDSLQNGKFYSSAEALDAAWAKVVAENPSTTGFYYGFPDTTDAKSAISFTVYPTAGQYFNTISYNFDRHTLKKLGRNEIYDKPFAQASFAGKLRRMNYDIHVGSILGFPGKVLAFLSALIGASLPVTGFIVWWNRKGFGKKKKSPKKAVSKSESVEVTQDKKPLFRPKVVAANPAQIRNDHS